MDKKKGKKISDWLRETIEEQIATGVLPPGSKFDEVSLAEKYEVSRTPVREALIQLAAEGLIELRPRRGALVSTIGPTRLIEMFEVMGELEAMCARLAVRRMTAEELDSLKAAHLACEKAVDSLDPDEYFYCNEKFHHEIYRGSHNEYLIEQAMSLHRRLRPYRRLQLRVRNRIRNSFSEHVAILEAILQGDDQNAEQSIRKHVLVQGERFTDLLASLPAITET